MSHFDQLISQPPDSMQKCFCTPDRAIQPPFQMKYVSAFQPEKLSKNCTKQLKCANIQTPCIVCDIVGDGIVHGDIIGGDTVGGKFVGGDIIGSDIIVGSAIVVSDMIGGDNQQ